MAMETFDRVKAVLVDVLDLASPDAVTDHARIRDDIGADSLDEVEIVMGLEEEFDLEIGDEDWDGLVTVGDAVTLIDKLAGVSA